MKAFLAACWQRRWFRRLAWTFATLLTLLVLFDVWVNWVGARRWQAAQSMVLRSGESLDVRKIGPDPVPDEQNFCAIPLLRNLPLQGGPEGERAEANRNKLATLALPADEAHKVAGLRPKALANASTGTPGDLKAYADWLRKEGSLSVPPDSGNPARDVLAGLAKHDAIVAELAAGLNRNDAQWIPSWRTREFPATVFEIAVPHYSAMGAVGQYLAYRATAAGAAGETAKARESILILLRLARASLDEPILIGSLVGAAQVSMSCNAVWDLCRLHAGTEEDFRRLELELRRLDFRVSLLQAFRFETAGGADAMQWLKHRRDAPVLKLFQQSDSQNAGLGFLAYVVPAGWFDMNAAVIVESYHHFVIEPLRDEGLAECILRQPILEQRVKADRSQPLLHLDSIFFAVSISATSKICPRQAYTQDIVNQAIIACALERYYAAHHDYPDTLAALDLEGRPLPLDMFSKQIPHYRKSFDGRYALWSVGFDGVDDGGKRGVDPKNPEKTKFHETSYKGDWVWDFPANNP